MSERGQVGFLGNLMGLVFAIPALMFGWKVYGAFHPPAPSIPVEYEQNAVPMDYTDECGEEPVCVWWWHYDETGAPGWRLYTGPDFPPGARPAASLPVLAVQP